MPHYDPSPLCMATRQLIDIGYCFDYCRVPSERPFYAVLEDIVRHGVENPKHGIDCPCLDTFSYELHAHVNRALPEVKRIAVELDPGQWNDPGDEWREERVSRDARLHAQWRITHVLRMILRRL